MIEPDKVNTKTEALNKLEADINSKLSSLLVKDKIKDPHGSRYLREDIQKDLCEYNWLIVKNFLSLMQSNSISREQIRELHARANRFNQDLDVIFPKGEYRPSFYFKWTNLDERQEHTSSPHLSIFKGSYGREVKYAPYIIKNNLITSLLFFNNHLGRDSKFISSFTLEYNFASQLFSDENLLMRIYFAVIFDNPLALKFFLDQVIILNPQRTYKNTIDDFQLVGIAAANGCIKVLRFFIESKANFERKYIIDTNVWNYKYAYEECDLRSLLLKYRNYTLEMSALALAISTLPAIHEKNAIELLDLLLSAGADPNQNVIIRGQKTGEKGFRDEEDGEEDINDDDEVGEKEETVMRPFFEEVKLVYFDHTGIFSEVIRRRQTQSVKKTLPVISGGDIAVITELNARIAMLEGKHGALLEKVNMSMAAQAEAFKVEIEKRDNLINLLQKQVAALTYLIMTNSPNLQKQISPVARRPNSFWHTYKERRQPLRHEKQVKDWLKNAVPKFQLINAIPGGDSFFDAFASGLNQVKGTTEFSYKSLRLLCSDYAKNSKNAWLAEANKQQGEDHENYCKYIAFTAADLELEAEPGQARRIEIWGRAKVEGRILCEKFGVKLHILEVKEDGSIHHAVVDQQGEQIHNPIIDYSDLTIHLVNYHNHFASLIINNALDKSDQQTASELIPQETTGFGDCGIHATLGKWNGYRFHCEDVKAKRKEMANEIRNSATDATLYPLVKEAIRALVMENKSTGKIAITQAQKEFQAFTGANQSRMQVAWDEFNRILNQYPSAMQFIDSFCKEYCVKKTILFEKLSQKDKFQICLNEGNTLRDLLFRVTDLEEAFTVYNRECNAKFDWEQIYSNVNVLDEYADFIETSGNWFLPVDLQILCHVFNITMDYYLKDQVTQKPRLIATYNPNKSQRVSVCFNGINHYEQMARENQLILKPINVLEGVVCEAPRI